MPTWLDRLLRPQPTPAQRDTERVAKRLWALACDDTTTAAEIAPLVRAELDAWTARRVRERFGE